MEQREGELVYLKLDMDGADGKALSSQGILAGTEYEYYKPFDDAPEYEEYKEVPKWLKVVAGVAVAAVVGLAVAATAASDQKNGTESSLGDYISNAFSASARVGASCIAITLGMYGAEVMTLTVSGGLGLIPVGGTVVTLPQLAGAFLLVAGTVTSQNLLFQMREVLMFCISGKEMGAPTGNWLYDSARDLTEMASMQFAVYGLMNPYTYQRPKITPLPNETGLTVPGGTGVAVVPNGTAPALNPPYLPGQYTEYPAAVQGWAQQALPGGGSGIESGLNSNLLDELANSGVKYNPEDIVAITKTADGKLVWLENGTDTAGLNHIITEHADDFLNKGITQEQIPDYVMNALENGKIVGYQGRGTGRPIYEFTYNGEIHKVAITVGNNGFIVGANPK